MSWLPVFALVALPRGCSSPPVEDPDLPPSWELGPWMLPSGAQQDAYDAQGRHARIVEWIDQECVDASGWCMSMKLQCGGLDLEIMEGEDAEAVRLVPFMGSRASAPLWVGADHILVARNDGLHARLVRVEREGDSWHVPAPLFELEDVWMEPLAVDGHEALVRVTAARFRWENDGVATGWHATSPEELRALDAGESPHAAEWTGESLHRLYWLDLEDRRLRSAGVSAWWYAARSRGGPFGHERTESVW